MQYHMVQSTCQLPNTGLQRSYTFTKCRGDLLIAGTQSGEVCVFSVNSAIYRASMPLSSNGVCCGTLLGDFLFVGAGDGKIKKISLENNSWTLTHEAALDSKVVSVNLSPNGQELIVGTAFGKIYRVLVNDFSYLLHTDSHHTKINDLSFGNDSNQFVAIDEGGLLKVWDLSEYKTTLTLNAGKQVSGLCCHIASDDGTVITGWNDGFMRCFDIQNQKSQLWEIANCHRGPVTAVYADANYILTGGQDGAVRVWSRAARKLLV